MLKKNDNFKRGVYIVKRLILVCGLLLCIAAVSFAGDIASFVDLGFSENSVYYMFAQYGINERSLPYAEVFTVDVASNSYAPEGVLKEEYTVPVQPGQEGLGALLMLMRKGEDAAERYGINHLRTGRLVYILLNGEDPKKTVQFRDFQTGKEISVSLIQEAYGTDKNVSSSFYLKVSVETSEGKMKNFTAGLPGYKRKGVKSYTLRKIFVSPDDRYLIFVIEKNEAGKQGINIRYMVETAKLP